VTNQPRRLTDETLVVRGGLVTPESVQAGADEHPEGYWGISVQSSPGLSEADLARAGRIPHGTIRATTVGQIRSLGSGFDVVSTRGFGHHATLVIPSRPVADRDAVAVSQAFGRPVRNPARVRESR
jgi:hypothetical protein